MRLYLNDLTNMPKKCVELDETVVCMSGYDKPRYINPRLEVGGHLGFDTWIDHLNKPSFNANAVVGSLTIDKYYSIMVVPVDGNTVGYYDFQRGTPTQASMPVLSAEDEADSGTATASGTTTLTDSTKSWTVNDFVGYKCTNTANGNIATVVSNTATVLTLDSDLSASINDTYTLANSSLGIIFDVPVHDQVSIRECATDSAGVNGSVTDLTQEWFIDELVGFTVINIENQSSAVITANSETVITASGLLISADDRVQVTKQKCTRRDIYALEMTSPDGASGTYIYQDTVANNTDTTYSLESYAPTGETVPTNDIPPDGYAYCVSADNRIFAAGGIVESRGSCFLDSESMLFDTTIVGGTLVSVITDRYDGANDGKVMRYSISAGSISVDIYIGSYVTIAGCADAENDIVDAQVVAVDSGKAWFDIINNSGVASSGASNCTLDIVPNSATPRLGSIVYFSDGLLGGSFKPSNMQSLTIGWISADHNIITFSEKLEASANLSDGDFEIVTDYGLGWSDYGDPHVWRSENSIQISDVIISLAVHRGLILIFGRRSLWKIPLTDLSQAPTLVSSAVYIKAPFSIVETPDGVLFYDGSGISITDGQIVRSVTQYKASEFLLGINQTLAHNVKGVHDAVNHRTEFVMPRGTDVTNNDGLYITTGSLNVYPFTRIDCNTIWQDEDENGLSVIKHGTSGRHVDSGVGTVWSHGNEDYTDGERIGLTGSGIITAIHTDYITVDADFTVAEGDILLHSPATDEGGSLFQFVVEKVDAEKIYIGADWYTAGLRVGGSVLLGMIPFSYGIKWLDFSSPQYQHKVRQIQIDVTDIVGKVSVYHYSDLSDIPVGVSTFDLTADDTKIVAPIKKGSCYTYGFRIIGASLSRANILSFEVLFDTEI